MTALSKPVRRTTATKFRELVVTLDPGASHILPPTIELREKRCRASYRIGLNELYVLLVARAHEPKRRKRASRI